MPGNEQLEPTADDDIAGGPACVALVPLVQVARRSHIPGGQVCRPNPTFLTHLIATAEQVPQTRSLRRATPLDAQIAYNANQHWVQPTHRRGK